MRPGKPKPTKPPTPPPLATYQLVFEDDFGGPTLDLTKWRSGWKSPVDGYITTPPNSQEIQAYDPACLAIAGGELDFTAVQRHTETWGTPPHIFEYASGMVSTRGKRTFVYGKFEARLWLPAGEGLWPAFWLVGENWPEDGEIDVLEAYGTDRCTFNYHYQGADGQHVGVGGGVELPGATAGWHTYEAEWTPGLVVWRYDGREVWRYSQGITAQPMFLVLNLGMQAVPATGLPASLRVDYVRVWQRC